MPNQVDGKIQEQRSKKLIELSNKNEKMYNEKYIDKELEVLFEEQQDGVYVGHTKNYIIVKTESDENLENKIVKVTGKQAIGNYIIAK